jgi:tRNA G10  N-methylase Trm11
MLYAFELGREWKVSLAEIEAIFGRSAIISVQPKLACIDTQLPVSNIASTMGGVIRAFELVQELRDAKMFPHRVAELIRALDISGKIPFGLGQIWGNAPLFSLGLRLKKDIRSGGETHTPLNVRFVNKDDQNLVSAVVKKEWLVGTKTEFFLLSSGNTQWLARTIFIQDIDAYSARDTGKTRDMEVGMLPPKLAQMMLSLALGNETWVVMDPFSGLGTVLIEAAQRWIREIHASDINPDMVEATKNNLANFLLREKQTDTQTKVTLRDAAELGQYPELSRVTHIVTEGYLGRIFGQHSVREELVEQEKQMLFRIYVTLFAWLKQAGWKGTMVITIPCWELKERSVYFSEFYSAAGQSGYIPVPLLSDRPDVRLTKYGSLIYRRPWQTVWREIVKLRFGELSPKRSTWSN